MSKKKLLCICLGNICRSPIAEAVFVKLIKERKLEGWTVDSAALGSWYVGRSPDNRALSTLERHNVPNDHKARQINKDDYENFDFIFGMDEDNMHELNRRAPKNSKAQLILLGSYDPEGDHIIEDPYYDEGAAGFERCYQQCMRACAAFLDSHSG